MDKKQSKNTFSFNIRIFDSHNSYNKKIKDIFIRKKDIYLIKLLERRTKNNKITKLNKSLKKLASYSNNEKNDKVKNNPKEKKLKDYRNIRIIRKKLENSANNNYILNNIIDESNNDKNQLDDLITSKIYNSDSSRNNKTMLNVHNENILFDNNITLKTIYEKNNFLKTKYNKTALNLFKQNQRIENPFETNIKFRKKEKNIYTDYNSKPYNDLKHSLIQQNNLISKKMKKDSKKNFPIYENIFNKININESQNDSNNFNEHRSKKYKSNNKTNHFHNIFNLFKVEKMKDKRDKYAKNFERNNCIKINHSLTKEEKDENTKIADNLFNGLPNINRRPNKN